MSIDQIANETGRSISELLQEYNLDPEHEEEMTRIVEKSLLKAIRHINEVHKEAIVTCCGPEADLAHKIQESADRKTNALIRNLSALR